MVWTIKNDCRFPHKTKHVKDKNFLEHRTMEYFDENNKMLSEQKLNLGGSTGLRFIFNFIQYSRIINIQNKFNSERTGLLSYADDLMLIIGSK